MRTYDTCCYLLLGSLLLTGLFPNVLGDAALYASISKGILHSQEWFDLKLLGRDYLQKPPLYFWLSAVSMQVFGIGNIGFKLPALLLAIAGIFGTKQLGQEVYQSTEISNLSAWMYAFSIPLILFTNDVHMDVALMGIMPWVLYFYLRYINSNSRQWIWGALLLSAALLIKGPISGFILLTAIISAAWGARRPQMLFRSAWFISIPLVLLCISPYLHHLYQTFGWDGIYFFLIENNTGRISGDILQNSKVDYSFYLHTFLWLFLPWSLISYLGLYQWIRGRLQQQKTKLNLGAWYLVGSFLPYLFIASLSVGHAPHYMLAVIPSIAILTSKTFVQIKNIRQLKYAGAILIIVIGLALNAYIFPQVIRTYDAPFWAAQQIKAQDAKIHYFLLGDHQSAEFDFYSKSIFGSYSPKLKDWHPEKVQKGDWIFTNERGFQHLKTYSSFQISQSSYPYVKFTEASKYFRNPNMDWPPLLLLHIQ